MRLYHIQRLFKSIIVLSKLVRQRSEPYAYDFTQIPFKNDVIIFYVNKMKHSKSLDPLFHLWHHFVSYKFIDDKTFLKEFITLLCMVHTQIKSDLSQLG